jgi:hypothetical protein
MAGYTNAVINISDYTKAGEIMNVCAKKTMYYGAR